MEKPVAKKAKAPIIAIIFTAFAILGLFISLGADITVNFIPSLGVSNRLGLTAILGSSQLIGMVLFLVGLFLHRKNGNILCGVGVVLNAVSVLSDLISDTSILFISTDLIIALFLIIAAVFYFTRIKVLGMPLKLIFGAFAVIASFVAAGGITYIVASSAALSMGLDNIFSAFNYAPYVIVITVSNLLSAFTAFWFYLAIVFFTPKKG